MAFNPKLQPKGHSMVMEIPDTILFVKHRTSNFYWVLMRNGRDLRNFKKCTGHSFHNYQKDVSVEMELDATFQVIKKDNVPKEGFRIVRGLVYTRTQEGERFYDTQVPNTVTLYDPEGATVSLPTISLLKMIYDHRVSIINRKLIGKFVYAWDSSINSTILIRKDDVVSQTKKGTLQ